MNYIFVYGITFQFLIYKTNVYIVLTLALILTQMFGMRLAPCHDNKQISYIYLLNCLCTRTQILVDVRHTFPIRHWRRKRHKPLRWIRPRCLHCVAPSNTHETQFAILPTRDMCLCVMLCLYASHPQRPPHHIHGDSRNNHVVITHTYCSHCNIPHNTCTCGSSNYRCFHHCVPWWLWRGFHVNGDIAADMAWADPIGDRLWRSSFGIQF